MLQVYLGRVGSQRLLITNDRISSYKDMLCLLVYYYVHVISVLILVLVVLLDSELLNLLSEKDEY